MLSVPYSHPNQRLIRCTQAPSVYSVLVGAQFDLLSKNQTIQPRILTAATRQHVHQPSFSIQSLKRGTISVPN